MNNFDDFAEIKKQIELLQKRAFYNEKLNEVWTTAPSYIPKTFREQLAYYETGGVKRLYFYAKGVWSFVVLT